MIHWRKEGDVIRNGLSFQWTYGPHVHLRFGDWRWRAGFMMYEWRWLWCIGSVRRE